MWREPGGGQNWTGLLPGVGPSDRAKGRPLWPVLMKEQQRGRKREPAPLSLSPTICSG